jgi:hypothetical protein
MGTQPPDRDVERYEDIDPEDLLEEPGLEVREIDDEAFRTPDGSSDEPYDPAMQPVIDAGGGVAEGFEQSEAELIDNATHADDGGTERILEDAFDPEDEVDRGVYGEADEEDVSEDET